MLVSSFSGGLCKSQAGTLTVMTMIDMCSEFVSDRAILTTLDSSYASTTFFNMDILPSHLDLKERGKHSQQIPRVKVLRVVLCVVGLPHPCSVRARNVNFGAWRLAETGKIRRFLMSSVIEYGNINLMQC